MNVNLYIARKIWQGKQTGNKIAGPIITVASIGITLGIIVMILSLCIGEGFKREIRNKIANLNSHVQIVNYDYNSSFETNPITQSDSLINAIKHIDGVKHVQRYSTKPGIIKTSNNIQGIILKGIGADYDSDFLKHHIIEGVVPSFTSDSITNEILISEKTAKLLSLNLGDKISMYFFQDRIKARRYTITGIFNTNLSDFDNAFAFINIQQISKLNNWESNQFTGYEIELDNFDQIVEKSRDIDILASKQISQDGSMLRVQNVTQTQGQIFGWLSLLDMNVAVIIVLIMIVAGFNMVSGLLIIILERTSMIGILKALGKQNWNIRKVFLYVATFIVGRSLIIGNIIAISLCLLQQYFGIIQLNPDNYYLETVPVYINFMHILYLNIACIVISYLMMILPSYLITKITPVEAIKFD